MDQGDLKLRVCVVSTGMPFVHGGAELRAWRHVKFLREKGNVDATLVVWDQGIAEPRHAQLGAYVIPVKLWSLNSPPDARFLRMLWLVVHILEIYLRLGWFFFRQRKDIEVVHVIFSSSWFNLIAVSIAKFFGLPTILEMTTARMDDPMTLNRRAGQKGKQIFPHKPVKFHLFQQADAYVSKSHPLTEAYQQSGLKLENLHEIASGVNTEMFHPIADTQEKMVLRDALGLERDGLHALFAGRVHPVKGLTELVTAFTEIASEFPKAYLSIVGPVIGAQADYDNWLKMEIVKLGMEKRISLLGPVANVNEYLRAADLFVLPTKQEGFSGAILEAMASGLPIITSDIPEISQSQIRAGKEGVLVPIEDVDALVVALTDLLADAKERQRLGQNALERVRREFTQDQIMRTNLKLYQSLCKRDTGG